MEFVVQALRRKRVAELQQEEEEGVSDSNSESERRVWLTHIKMANLKAADRIVNIQQVHSPARCSAISHT